MTVKGQSKNKMNKKKKKEKTKNMLWCAVVKVLLCHCDVNNNVSRQGKSQQQNREGFWWHLEIVELYFPRIQLTTEASETYQRSDVTGIKQYCIT